MFSRGGLVFYGCLKYVGRTRLLLNGETGYAQIHDALIAVRLAGRFAAIATEDGKPPDFSDNATLYDLSSGKATRLADVFVPGPGVEYGLDSLALDSSGFAACRETTSPTTRPLTAVSCPSASLCVAGDVAGNILSSTNPTGRADRVEQRRSVTTTIDPERLVPVELAMRRGRLHRQRPHVD